MPVSSPTGGLVAGLASLSPETRNLQPLSSLVESDAPPGVSTLSTYVPQAPAAGIVKKRTQLSAAAVGA